MNISDKDFEEISDTAIVTSYPRIFTDIPYEKDIYNWLDKHYKKDVKLDKNLAPEIEARYKLTDKILNKSGITQVLELASGYSSRGLIYSKKDYKYIEMDLKNVISNKKIIVNDVNGSIPENLVLLNGNALNEKDYLQIDSFLDKNKEVAIINEGLLRYLSFEEKRIVGQNIYKVLKKYGGIWVTCDCTPKKFIESQNKALPGFNKDLNNVTIRNHMNDRFDDIEHVERFFGEIGLMVEEVHPFSEVRNELYSMNENHITNDNLEKYLDDAIVVVMKIKSDM